MEEFDDFDETLFDRIYEEVVEDENFNVDWITIARECAHRYCKAIDRRDFEHDEDIGPAGVSPDEPEGVPV